MKVSVFLTLIFSATMAFASQNLNHIGCYYRHTPSGWNVQQIFISKAAFNLAEGEGKGLTRGWTGGKPVPPNYGYCTRMVGTNDDNAVVIESLHYQAKSFSFATFTDDCLLIGTEVELISKTSSLVQRGNFSQLESEWAPPHVDKIQIREYFPLIEEMDKLNEISAQKCAELMPTE